jgi:hypothetical protein
MAEYRLSCMLPPTRQASTRAQSVRRAAAVAASQGKAVHNLGSIHVTTETCFVLLPGTAQRIGVPHHRIDHMTSWLQVVR